MIATLPVTAGLPSLLIREVSKLHQQENWSGLKGIINWARLYAFIASAIMVVILTCIISLELFEEKVALTLFAALALVPLKGWLTQQGAILNAFKEPVLAQLPALIFPPTLAFGVLIFCIYMNVELSAFILVLIGVITSLIALVSSYFLVKKFTPDNFNEFSPEYQTKPWLVALMPFSFVTIVSVLNTELGSVLLGLSSDKESVAYFKVAMQGVAIIAIGLTAVNTIIMPDIANSFNKQGEIQPLLTKSVRLSAIVSLPIILILILFGDFFITLFFGMEYLPAYPILVVLCVGQIFNVIMGSVGVVLNMTGNEKQTLKGSAIALFITVLLMLILLPSYGAIGVASAVAVGLALWNVGLAVEVYRLTKLKTWVK